MRCGFGCLLAVAWGDVDALSSHQSSYLIDHHLDRLLPALRHDWAGRVAGSGGVLCLLGFILRSVPMSAGVDSRFVPFPSSAVLSLGLLACRIGCGDDCVLISSVRDVLRCPACPLARLSPFAVPSVGSVHHLSLAQSCDTIGGEEGDCVAVAACFTPRPDFAACLVSLCLLAPLPFFAIHLIRMAAEVCGLSARRAVCLLVLSRCIRAVLPLVARSFPFIGRSIDAALCRSQMLWV